jgi:hypothetical protein
MDRHGISALTWIRSSYSGDNGGNCVEIAPAFPGNTVPARDSKNPDGPVLLIGRSAWTAFVSRP